MTTAGRPGDDAVLRARDPGDGRRVVVRRATRDDGVLRVRDLGDGRQVVVRRATRADAAAAYELFGRLSRDDLRRRFFTGRMPARRLVEQWVSPDRAGSSLVAEVVDGDERTVVGEAGYSLLPDGDGELAITVDPEWRGGLGRWLFEALVDDAAARGVPNLHADVLLANAPMIGLLRRRGMATVEHPDVGEVRLVIGTSGDMPGWPAERSRPRLVVEGVRGMWWGEHLARDAGFDLRICRGPGDEADRCPVLRGEHCPLIDGADAVLSSFPEGDAHGREIAARLSCANPGLTILFPGDDEDAAESAARLIDDLTGAAGERPQAGQASVASPE